MTHTAYSAAQLAGLVARNPVARAALLAHKPQVQRLDTHAVGVLVPTTALDELLDFFTRLGIQAEEARQQGQAALMLVFEASKRYVQQFWRHLFAYRPPKRPHRACRGHTTIKRAYGRR